MNRFIIIGQGRSGTTMLRNYLASHGAIAAFGELFAENIIVWQYKQLDQIWNNSFFWMIRNEHPDIFIDTVFRMRFSSDQQAIGFKILYNDIERDQNAKLLSYLASGVKIIHIVRNNLLELEASRMVSDLRLAEKKTLNSYRPDDIETTRKIKMDPESAEKAFSEIVDLVRSYCLLGNERKKVVYEELCVDPDRILGEIQEFIGVEKRQLHIRGMYKTIQQPMDDLIENYAELKKHFEGGKYERFFK